MSEVLAIIRGVNIGVGDYGHPNLWFSTYVNDASAALQVFNWDDAGKIIKDSGLRNALQLEGKPCYVDYTDKTIKFIRLVKM